MQSGCAAISFQRRRYPFEEGAFLYDQMFGHYQVRILEQRLVVYEFFRQTSPMLFFEPEVFGLHFQACSTLPFLN